MPEDEEIINPIEIENESDRPISEDGYLDENGICFFPGPEAEMPAQVHIAAPVNFLAFVKGLIVIDNDSEEGYKTVKYTFPEKPGGLEVLGLVLNKGAIELLQKKYNGKAFLLKEPNGNDWMTLDEWTAKFSTDGLDVLARMRWEWFVKGGGVGTPGQRVTGAGQVGHAQQIDPGNFKKLGRY